MAIKRGFRQNLFIYIFILDLIIGVAALNLDQCQDQLGMEDKRIPDSAITASSTHSHKSVGPQNSRIRNEINGGAWCPKMIDKDSYEYLQIDLGRMMVITKVEVQGRFGNGKGLEYAEQFLLEYQREDEGEWMRFRDRHQEEKFDGNENTYTEAIREVSPPIIGKRIRFIPFSQKTRQVCMRVEMYGCPWTDAVVSYDLRQGDTRGTENSFYDFTYDGMHDNGFLSGGLGQLTDGETGEANFRLASSDINVKGYEWVGWRNDTSQYGGGPVEIAFKFENVRNFTSVSINCNNYFSKNVRVFRRALVYFSIGGEHYLGEPVKYDFQQDRVMDYNHEVTIDLKHNVGQFVKFKLYFDAKWMLISEVEFDSVPAEGNFTTEEAPPTTVYIPPRTQTQSTETSIHVVQPNEGKTDKPPIHETASHNEDYISIIIGALAALLVILTIIVIFVIVRHRRRQNINRQSLKPVSDTVLNINLNNFQNNVNGKVSNGNVYNGVSTEDDEHVKEMNGKGEVYN